MAKKENVIVIKNFLNKNEIDEALKILESKPRTIWEENPATEIVSNTILEVSALVTKYAYKTSEIIKEKFNVKEELYCLTSHLGTWKNGEGLEIHDDTYGASFTQFSSVIYLNDDYSGGKIMFPELHIALKPEAGDLLFFPSKGYWHEVSPVISGSRSTIVGFYTKAAPDTWEAYPKPEISIFGSADYYSQINKN